MTAAPALSFASMSLHLGEEIERRRLATGMSKTELAERIGVDRSHVYDIIASPTCDTGKLKRCCKALRFNFFSLLSAECEEELGMPAGSLVSDPQHVYGRRPAAQRSPLRVVIEVDPGDDEAQQRALRMARELQGPAPDRDKEGR